MAKKKTAKKKSKFCDMHSREIALHRERQKAKLVDVMKVRDFNNS